MGNTEGAHRSPVRAQASPAGVMIRTRRTGQVRASPRSGPRAPTGTTLSTSAASLSTATLDCLTASTASHPPHRGRPAPKERPPPKKRLPPARTRRGRAGLFRRRTLSISRGLQSGSGHSTGPTVRLVGRRHAVWSRSWSELAPTRADGAKHTRSSARETAAQLVCGPTGSDF